MKIAVSVRSSCYALLFWALLIAVAPATAIASGAADPHRLVAAALDQMNAGVDPRSLKALKIEGGEVAYDIVENDHPGSPYYVTITHSSRVEDFSGRRELTEVLSNGSISQRTVATPSRFITAIGEGAAQKTITERASPSWETENPIRALEMAMGAPDLRAEPDRLVHQSRQHVVSFKNGRYRVRLFIDAATGLLNATEAIVSFDRPISPDIAFTAWGDVAERTEFMNWTFGAGLRYPFQSDIFRNGVHFRTFIASSISQAAADERGPGDEGSGATPELTRTADEIPLGAPVAFAPNPRKPIAEIAPSIVQIPGSWYTTLVRQDDGVVVIDAPISAGYSKRVIAEAHRRFPGLPVKALITSTGFFWHTAGVREYAAQGIPIYAEARNADTVRRMLRAPHSLAPDDLSRCRCKSGGVIPVHGRMVIGRGRNRIEVMPIATATEPMLMTYIPDAQLLHAGEMVQPFGPGGSILYPEALIELTHAVEMQRLAVKQIIGMHVSPTDWSEIGKTLAKAGARA